MINLTDGIDNEIKITEGIIVDDFDSREEGLYLVNRIEPYPVEKEVRDEALFMQGDYDFSMILGERFYNNRSIGYEFILLETNYQDRKIIQMKLQNWLGAKGQLEIHDTAKPDYYRKGKLRSVEVEDDHVYGRLRVVFTFDCYPFIVAELQEGHDIWDKINFELDILQPVYFEVNGTERINLLYNGNASVAPKIKTNGPVEVTKGNYTFNINSAGTHSSEQFRITNGDNLITLKGNATVEFVFYKELI